MRRGIAVALAGVGLAGCSSFSTSDTFRSAPPTVPVRLESNPPGAEATTSLGPGCKTPCSVSVPIPPAPDAGFSVTFSLNKYPPVTIPVQIAQNPGDISTPASIVTNPSPVFAELKKAKPAKGRKGTTPKRRPKPTAAPVAPAAPAAGGPSQSPFPEPSASPPDSGAPKR